MSYILDALRKAEHERNIGDTPRLSFSPLSESSGSRPWVLWAVVATLGITVGVLGAMQIGQMRSNNAEALPGTDGVAEVQKPTLAVTPAANRQEAPARVVQSAPASRKVQVNTPQGPVAVEMPLAESAKTVAPPSKSRMQPQAQPIAKQAVAPRPAPEKKSPAETVVKPAPVAKPAPTPAAAASESIEAQNDAAASRPKLVLPSAADVAAEYESSAPVVVPEEYIEPDAEVAAEPEVMERIPSYLGLPASTRSNIGELSMAAHVYSSTPGRGFVIINGARYRTGDNLDEGPVVDEIRPEGVVLNYRGQRFMLPVQR